MTHNLSNTETGRKFVLTDKSLQPFIAIDALRDTPTVRLYAANLDEAERRFAEQLVPSTAENLTRFGHRSCRSIRWDDAGERHHVYITIDPEVTL